jgi:hypothetical protein
MKSVGEVMSIARTFPEALQKALRMIDIGVTGFEPGPASADVDLEKSLRTASPWRIFAVARALTEGVGVECVAELTRIDPFFIHQLDAIARVYRSPGDWRQRLGELKRLGFSDGQIARLFGTEEPSVRAERDQQKIAPALLQIDTLAAEYPARTNYTYLTYGAASDDVAPPKGAVLILGSGPYRIGSSVEFDWCCVSAARASRELGFSTVVLNCNPETVSTDYDTSDLK